MKYRFFLLLCLLLASTTFAGLREQVPSQNSWTDFARWVQYAKAPLRAKSVAAHETVFLPMEDGVKLYTSIYTPQSGGANPVILVRTPYNFRFQGEDAFSYRGIGDYYSARGYAVVIQTIRGKYDSEGTYLLLSNREINDGFTTIQWIAQQSWCNGKIAIMGVSHDGYDALAAGIRNPPALKLILAGGAPGDLRVDAFFSNGVASTGLLDYIDFITKEHGGVYEDAFYDRYLTRVLKEPRLKLHDNKVENSQLPMWDEIVTQMNTPTSQYWKDREIRSRLRKIRVPVVHIAGLSGDGDMPDTIRNFQTMYGVPAIRNKQRLILGDWAHSGSGPYADFTNVIPYLLDRYNAYLDFYLKGISSPLLQEKRVQMFSIGQDQWIYADKYPVTAGATKSTWYLAPNGGLSKQLPSAASSEFAQYTTNPAIIPKIWNQDVLFTASDQVVFLSQPFTSDVYLLGDADFRLFGSTNGNDADFIAILFKRDLEGNDVPLDLLTAKIQGRFRNGAKNDPVLMIPNEVTELKFSVIAISTVIRSGEKLGLLILSNLNPGLVRNANTGKLIGTDTTFRIAKQRIYHSSRYPSSFTLLIRK